MQRWACTFKVGFNATSRRSVVSYGSTFGGLKRTVMRELHQPSEIRYGKISLRDVEIETRFTEDRWHHPHGLERLKVSCDLSQDLTTAALDDTVEHSINYTKIADAFREVSKERITTGLDELAEALSTSAFQCAPSIQKFSMKIVHEKFTLRGGSLEADFHYTKDSRSAHRTFTIRSLRTPTIIGLNECEKDEKQDIIVTVQFLEPLQSITNSILKALLREIIEILDREKCQTLEALSHRVAYHLSRRSQVFRRVNVNIQKPYALAFVNSCGVEVSRMIQPIDRINEETVAYIAFGSNMGDRAANIEKALKMLDKRDILVQDTSALYESPPMYYEEQPKFLNGVCKVSTHLGHLDLLQMLKAIEIELGRVLTVAKGPRVIDLDILLFGELILQSSVLTIPHISMLERSFVLQPLADIAPNIVHPVAGDTIGSLYSLLLSETNLEALPLYLPNQSKFLKSMDPIGLFDVKNSTGPSLAMAILNMTPDSFSDGGCNSVNSIRSLLQQVSTDNIIVDVGGQSTRPHATLLPAQHEIDRIRPVLQMLKNDFPQMTISVDTFYSEVAEAAIAEGAHIVNDVSGGLLDPRMHSTIAELGCPYIIMHMRGTPSTMVDLATYDDVVQDVGRELEQRVEAAISAGVYRWQILLDPGLGFAKKPQHSLELIRRLPELKRRPKLQGMTWIVGPSRKDFLGKIIQQPDPLNRDWATAAAVSACVAGGAHIIRIHALKEMLDVIKTSNAIYRGGN